MENQVSIYTDGAARGNPGPGGYGIILFWKNVKKELSQGFRLTTNNRMELLAVIIALESLKRKHLEVTVHSDSSYVVNAIEKDWLQGWVKKNFKGKKNEDLWRRYLNVAKDQKVKFVWVKGHANNTWNNRCDELATAAADGNNLLIDEVYENEKKSA